MKKLYLVVTIFLLLSYSAFSQVIGIADRIYRNGIDSVIANLNKTAITTNILYPRVTPLALANLYDPIRTVSYDAETMRRAYYELFYSSYDTTKMLNPAYLFGTEDGFDPNPVAFGNVESVVVNILNFNVNVIDSLAIKNKLIGIKNGLPYDVPGRASTPFLTKHILIAAPNKTVVTNHQINFYLNNFGVSENSATVNPVKSLQFYSKDIGYNTLIYSGLINYDFHNDVYAQTSKAIGIGYGATYLTDTIKIVVTYADNTSENAYFPLTLVSEKNAGSTARVNGKPTFSVHTLAEIVQIQKAADAKAILAQKQTSAKQGTSATTNTIPQASPQTSDATTAITSSIMFQGYGETKPRSGIGRADFYYAANNTTHKLLKPVILLNGFDPDASRSNDIIYNFQLSYKKQDNTLSLLGNELRNLGYDLVILTFPFIHTVPIKFTFGGRPREAPIKTYANGADYIERNAFILYDLINSCNAQLKTNGSTEKLVIIGPSMGGLIARYALTYMESKKLNHNTRLWVSFDSPHLGANVPIGDQYFLNYSASYLGSLEAQNGRDYKIGSPAAQEMVINYASAQSGNSRTSDIPSPYRTAFLQSLASLGDWPTALRKVAISNGSIGGLKQFDASKNRLTSCQTLLDFEVRKSIAGRFLSAIVGFFTGNLIHQESTILRATVSSSGVGGKACEVFRGKNPGFWSGNYTTDIHAAAEPGATSVDASPGGYTTITGDLVSSSQAAAKDQIGLIGLPFAGTLTRTDNQYHSFIPTVSALALTKVNDFGENLSSRNLICDGRTPFSAYYAPADNEEHVNVNFNNVAFLKQELAGDISGSSGIGVYPANASGAGEFKISGPGSICSSVLASYSMSTTGAITWSVSPDLSIVSGNGTPQITVRSNGSTTANSFIQGSVPSLCGAFIVKLPLAAIGYAGLTSTLNGACNGAVQTWSLNATANISNATNWLWTVDNPATLTCYFSQANSSQTFADVKGGGGVTVSFTDACGVKHTNGVTIYSSCKAAASALNVYPNPAISVINVDFNTAPSSSSIQSSSVQPNTILPETVELYGQESASPVLSIGKKQIFNNNSVATFSIKGLKSGIYFIHAVYLGKVVEKTVEIN